MARSSEKTEKLPLPSASRQIAFHQLLVAARKSWLVDALQEALSKADPALVKAQASQYVPTDVQKLLSSQGVRDEYVFPLPAVIEEKPTLVGYYRLLLGLPQKIFYSSSSRMAQFKSMEKRGSLTEKQRLALPLFCEAMSSPIADLFREVSTVFSGRDVNDLPLLTLGAQFQGSNNNAIGKQATLDVFVSISEIVKRYTVSETEKRIQVRNASGRDVTILLGADPDVSIVEQFGAETRRKVAIEIKGGSDRSNAHNRAGEAEKSHQKAKRRDFRDFWTIIAKAGLDVAKLREESPTTTSWYDVTQVLGRQGEDWKAFRSRLCGEIGIPEPKNRAV
jgi:hypothetical protein